MSLSSQLQKHQHHHSRSSASVSLHHKQQNSRRQAVARRPTQHNSRQQTAKQQQQQQHFHTVSVASQRLLIAYAAATEAEEQSVSYEWSWQQRGRSHLPEADSQFDQQHQLPSPPTWEAISSLLAAAAAACEEAAAASDAAAEAASGDSPTLPAAQQQQTAAPPIPLPSQAWCQQVLTAAQPLLAQAPAAASCEVLQLLSRLDYTPDTDWMQQLLSGLCRDRLQDLSTQQLAGLVWSLSNLRHTPSQQHWGAILGAAQARLQDFYGPDLALLVCGAGSIVSSSTSSFDPDSGLKQQDSSTSPPPSPSDNTAATTTSSAVVNSDLTLPGGWADAVLEEVSYQVTQFPADLGAFDLARTASGLADLGISPSTQLQDKLLKAVYMRTRTIEEKGAVDFALAKLDAKGKKSMHYDPRWTHEELKWLPRRERDKRRLIKEGWYRTQWTGWR